jgi:SOS response associated peptidase (SRAP)/ATP dependent DNA ligase-like protein
MALVASRHAWKLIAPGQQVPVIVREEGHNKMKLMRWGLVPSWAPDPSIGNRMMINARCEFRGQSVNDHRHSVMNGERTMWALTKEEMKNCIWLKPELVAQIEFAEWTPDGHLRHSKFVGLMLHANEGRISGLYLVLVYPRLSMQSWYKVESVLVLTRVAPVFGLADAVVVPDSFAHS